VVSCKQSHCNYKQAYLVQLVALKIDSFADGSISTFITLRNIIADKAAA